MTETLGNGVQRVFIIHGRNANAVRELSLFLRALGLEPWPFESVSAALGANPYVGDVVKSGITQAAIVIALFTPDERAVLERDFYQAADTDRDRRRTQSRPNVFFETGMALAIAGERTIMVTAGGVELPSDFGGKLLLRLSNEAGPRRQLREVLSRMQCKLRDSAEYLDPTRHGDFSDLSLFGREKPHLPSEDDKGVDLLLGPGGVRCLAFAGAIDAIHQNGYRIERVCGLSAGALIAASFARNADTDALVELARRGELLNGIRPPRWWQWPRVWFKPFAAQRPIPRRFFEQLLGGDIAFADLKLPLGVAALDIAKGRLLAYTSDGHPGMKVAEALTAGIAVPLYFPWVSAEDRVIVDAVIQTQSPLWLLSAFHAPRRNRAVVLSASVPSFQAPKQFTRYLGRLLEAPGIATDHRDVLQSRRLIRIPIAVRDHDFLAELSEAERMELVTQGREAVNQAIQTGLFSMPDQLPRVARQSPHNPHDIAEAEASSAAVRHAREIQRFASELDDE